MPNTFGSENIVKCQSLKESDKLGKVQNTREKTILLSGSIIFLFFYLTSALLDMIGSFFHKNAKKNELFAQYSFTVHFNEIKIKNNKENLIFFPWVTWYTYNYKPCFTHNMILTEIAGRDCSILIFDSPTLKF